MSIGMKARFNGSRYAPGPSGVRRAMAAVFLLLSVLSSGCSKDGESPPIPPEDTIPPGAVGDLEITDRSPTSAALRWTAPAEDGTSGGAVASYDLRYRFESLDAGVWDGADQAENEPVPSDPGRMEIYVLGGLHSDTLYAAALRSIDDAGLVSAISNVVQFRTEAGPSGADTIPPAAVVDLAITTVGATSLGLRWTATGDDGGEGTASLYDLRYRLGSLDGSNWEEAIRAEGEPVPGLPGTEEGFSAGGLNPATVYAFALRVADEDANVSDLSNVVVGTTEAWVAEFLDPRGIDSNRMIREVYVADHGDSSVYRTGMLGSSTRMATIPSVVGVKRSTTNVFYAIAGEEGPAGGRLWSFTGSIVEPVLLAEGFGFPSDLDIDPDGHLLVAVRDPGAVLRFGPQGTGPETLVQLPEGEVTGVVSDEEGNVYFGVEGTSGAVIRRRAPGGTVQDLHAPAGVGDLVEDPDGLGIWYLDPVRFAVLRLSFEGGTPDTLATGLANPVAIAPGIAGTTPALYYSSRDGFVVQVGLRR